MDPCPYVKYGALFVLLLVLSMPLGSSHHQWKVSPSQELPCPANGFNALYGFRCDGYIDGIGNVKPNLLNNINGEVCKNTDLLQGKGHNQC
jgi:hypothetical protein